MLQHKFKLLSEHVVDSLRHQDTGSDSPDADARTDFTCAPTTTDDFLAARVTVPAGDDYIGSDGAFPLLVWAMIALETCSAGVVGLIQHLLLSQSQLSHVLGIMTQLSLLSQV